MLKVVASNDFEVKHSFAFSVIYHVSIIDVRVKMSHLCQNVKISKCVVLNIA